MTNWVPSFGTTRTFESVLTIRNVDPVSSMTMPRRPMREGLRDDSTRRMMPVKSALRSLTEMPSCVAPAGSVLEEGMGEGSGGKLRRETRYAVCM